MIYKTKRRCISCLVVMIMILGMLPSAAGAASLTDITDHWAKVQIEDWEGKGLVRGYTDGTFKPDNSITRAEFMVLVNRAFDCTEKADIDYRDVSAKDWYVDNIARAKAAGYITGYPDDTVKPNNLISRQEAAIIIMKIKQLSANETAAHKFKDTESIPVWSKGAIGAVVGAGMMSGYPDGSFRAQASIKRGEAVAALSSAWTEVELPPVIPADEPKGVYDKAGTFGPASGTETIKGPARINSSDVILNNTIITGDLTIDEAVGDGDVKLNNVKVEGTVYINGGGENSITITGCELNRVIVNKRDGKIRILLSNESSIKTLIADSGLRLLGSGKITYLTINSSGVEIEPQPLNRPYIRSGISATVAGESVRGATSSGGGSSKVFVNAITITVTDEDDATTITEKGGTLQLSAIVMPANATNKEVTWSVLNPGDENVSDKATISASGLLTAVADGQARVKATAKDGSGKYGVLLVTISGQTPPAYASTDALTNATVSVANGTSEADATAALDETVGVVGTLGEKETATIAWTIASYDGATAGSYTATGVLTLPAGWTGTAANVIATVTVEAAIPPAYASTKILANATVSVENGTSEADATAALDETVEVVGTLGEKDTAAIAWTIAGYDGATAGSYTATGVLTLPAGWTGAAADVTATVTVEAIKYTYTILVRDDPTKNLIEGASVTIGDETIITNAEGKAIFKLPTGFYDLEIVMTGYEKVTGLIQVNNDVGQYNPLLKKTIASTAIAGVTAPAKEEVPVFIIAETDEYTAAITWSPADDTFAADTAYTATITITPKAGYTLTGVVKDFFTVEGATATNDADSGVVTAVFPKTAL